MYTENSGVTFYRIYLSLFYASALTTEMLKNIIKEKKTEHEIFVLYTFFFWKSDFFYFRSEGVMLESIINVVGLC